MKNYNSSDYAVNKKAVGIVYRYATETIEVTLEDYLRENPDKTSSHFAELKALSDSDYQQQDKNDQHQTRHIVPYDNIENLPSKALSLENKVINNLEKEPSQQSHQLHLIKQALSKLTETQKRRYLLYTAQGLTTRKIADMEGVAQTAVMESIHWAEKKIKKFLQKSKK